MGSEFYEPAPGEGWPELPPDVAVEQLGEEDTLALGIGRVVIDNLHLEAVVRHILTRLNGAGLVEERTRTRAQGLTELISLVEGAMTRLTIPGEAREAIAGALGQTRRAVESRNRVIHDRWFHDSDGAYGLAGWRQARQTGAFNMQRVERDFLDLWEAWEDQFDAGWAMAGVSNLLEYVLRPGSSLDGDELIDAVEAIRRPSAPQEWAPPPTFERNGNRPGE